ncbi:hypothetical protein AJ87_04965 [Rhizobium yanglingense]|nr:hypothetical protein AJ87_04965 [Rhizobium yanglingense]
MRDQLVDRYQTFGDRIRDMLEVGARRIAAADDRHFALVEFRVGKADVVLHDANQHQRAAMRHETESLLHRRTVARRVEHGIEAVAVRLRLHGFRRFVIGDNAGDEAESLRSHLQPFGTGVEQRYVMSGNP